MKRDLDLARQLLMDIEGHGADCALSALRPGALRPSALRPSAASEAEERLRYHVRLLIDTGYVKETDHPSNGVPCIRLTNAGHEFLELAYCDARWREAKWTVLERTGSLSLTVLKAVLTRWALEAASQGEHLRPHDLRRPAYFRTEARYEAPLYQATRYEVPRYEAPRFEPRYRYKPLHQDPIFYRRRKNREAATEMGNDELRLASARTADYLERLDWQGTGDWQGTRDWQETRDGAHSFDWRNDQDRDAYARDLYAQNLYAQNLRSTSYEPIGEYGEALPVHVV